MASLLGGLALVPNVNIRTAYGPKERVKLEFPAGEGRTKQSFKDECDINVIMRRYEKTGVLTHLRKVQPEFADCTGRDFNEAMNLVAEARTAFAELPSSVRDRFDNDPAKFLDFCQDEGNLDEAGELGLLSRQGMEKLAALKETSEQQSISAEQALKVSGESVRESRADSNPHGRRSS